MRGMGKAKAVIFRTSGAPGPALRVPEDARQRPAARGSGPVPARDRMGSDRDADAALVLMLQLPRSDSRSTTHRAELRLRAPGGARRA